MKKMLDADALKATTLPQLLEAIGLLELTVLPLLDGDAEAELRRVIWMAHFYGKARAAKRKER